jgi:CPA2 family monovalent cation:H+ antiporter-2
VHDPHAFSALAVQICLFLLATSVIVPLARSVGLSAVVAFLVIGVGLGPEGLGRLAEIVPQAAPYVFAHTAETTWLAELGVVFLLFAIGLEVSTRRLWSLRRFVLGLGGAQLLLTAVAISGVALAFGNTVEAAVVTGLAFALSSTAVVLQLLGERRQLSGAVGRAGFSVLLLQDLAVVPILFGVAALAAGQANEAGAGAGEVARAVLEAVGAVLLILAVGRYLMRPLLRRAAKLRSREVFVATALLAALSAALIAQAAGLSMALGAFLAGLLLAETEFRHEIEIDIEPFKALLLGLFFVTVGMQIDLDLLAAEPLRVIVGVVGLAALKAAILAPLARAFGLSWPKAIELSFLLAQAGEFGFIVIALAADAGLYPAPAADYMFAVVALSLLLTPTIADLGVRLGRLLDRRVPDQALEVNLPNEGVAQGGGHVIVAGYGRVGQLLGRLLMEQDFDHIAVDADPDLVSHLRDKGWPVLVGDLSRQEVLARLSADRAAAIVVTMNDFDATERIVTAARAAWPNVPIFARARDAAQARRLADLGAHHATPDAVEGALQLGGAVLEGLGVPDEGARRIIDSLRDSLRE